MTTMFRHGLGRGNVAAAVPQFPTTMPIGDLAAPGGTWVQIFHDDFKSYPDLAVGSFDPAASGILKSTCAAFPYMGANWTFYADGGNTTHGGKSYPILPGEPGYLPNNPDGTPGAYWPPINSKYYPTKTLSIVTLPDGDKAMQVYQHTENIAGVDTELGANMKPVNPAGTYKFDAYYRWQYMMRATEVLVDGVDRAAEGNFTTGTDNRRHWVPLGIDSNLWPQNGEIDWWEGSTNRALRGNYHPAAATNQTYPVPSGESPYNWNLATVEWSPGLMKWFTNSSNRLNTTDRVPTGPMAYQFQHESDWRQPPVGSTKVQIKWVSGWKWVAA